MPSFQIKALVVTPIGGDNFRLIPPNCMVSQTRVFRGFELLYFYFLLFLAIQNSLDGFRNTPNVRNNSKTSRWFPFIRSTTSCNWFFEVGIRISPLNTTNTSDRPNVSVVQRASKSGFLSLKRKFSFIGKHMPNQPYSWN